MTTEGNMSYPGSQIAGLNQRYRSEIRAHLKGQTKALENPAVETLARGLSIRDIENFFCDESGSL